MLMYWSECFKSLMFFFSLITFVIFYDENCLIVYILNYYRSVERMGTFLFIYILLKLSYQTLYFYIENISNYNSFWSPNDFSWTQYEFYDDSINYRNSFNKNIYGNCNEI